MGLEKFPQRKSSNLGIFGHGNCRGGHTHLNDFAIVNITWYMYIGLSSGQNLAFQSSHGYEKSALGDPNGQYAQSKRRET